LPPVPHIHCCAPVWNEECAVARFVEETAAALDACGRPWEIVLLDDGSTDGTRSIAEGLGRRLPVRLLPFPHRGIGAVLREFVLLAAKFPPQDAVIFTEGDTTCDPAFIGPALKALEAGADVCTASRFVEGAQVTGFPLRRRLQTFTANRLLRARFSRPGAEVTDYTLFARAYRAAALQKISPADLTGRHFETNAELLVRLLARGARVSEVPARYRYDLKAGPSKLPTLATIRGYGRLLAGG